MLIKKVPDVSGLVTTTILNTKTSKAEYKIMDNRSLLTTTVLTIKIGEVENRIPDHAKSVTLQELNNLTTEDFTTRLKQTDLVSKKEFDNKTISFNKRLPQIKQDN